MSIQVIVGNMGIVFDGDDMKLASNYFEEYKDQSAIGYGRAAYEQVTMMVDGEIEKEYYPEEA